MSKRKGWFADPHAVGGTVPHHNRGVKQWTSTGTMMERRLFGALRRAAEAYDGEPETSLGKPLDLKFQRFEEPGDFLEKVGGGKYTDILRWTAYDPPV